MCFCVVFSVFWLGAWTSKRACTFLVGGKIMSVDIRGRILAKAFEWTSVPGIRGPAACFSVEEAI